MEISINETSRNLFCISTADLKGGWGWGGREPILLKRVDGSNRLATRREKGDTQ